MSAHDTLGDFLTILRNASAAGKESCTMQHSKMRSGVARILKEEGYIRDFSESEQEGKKTLTVTLKYVNNAPALTGIERHSRPGRRLYYSYLEIPRVLGGLGTAILTTSKGILKDREARRQKVGGELICKVW